MVEDLKSIRRNSEGEKWFNNNLSWNVRKGSQIYFWDNVWVGEIMLIIYANSIHKSLKIKDLEFDKVRCGFGSYVAEGAWFEWENTMVDEFL